MIPQIYRVGAWCGALFLVVLGIGLWFVAGFVPPHLPTASAADIAQIYQADRLRIQIGMVVVMVAAGLYLPWTVTLAALIRRMEGEANFLSQCELIGGLAGSMFFALPALVWEIAAFRADLDPAMLRLVNDAGWLLLVTPVPPFLVQFITLAAAILLDKGVPRVFPRWFGFATAWIAALFLPGAAAYFFKTGPFAWNGLLAFWVPLAAFGLWEVAVLSMTFRLLSKTGSLK